MIKNLGCQYVIIGHSERINYLKETDEMINKKIKAALATGLKVILCLGETQEEKERGKTKEFLKTKLEKFLDGTDSQLQETGNLIIAYEPVWAVGSGIPCGINEAREVRFFWKSGRLFTAEALIQKML